LCLLAPNPTENREDIALFSESQLLQLEAIGHTVRKGIVASASVYDHIHSGAVKKRAPLVRARTRVVFGTEDPYYRPFQFERLAAHFNLREAAMPIEGADHNFLPLEVREKLLNAVCEFLVSAFRVSTQF